MRPVCSYTDYFVICTGQNTRQTKAIYDAVREEMKKAERLTPRTVAGERESSWILADYLDVVLHVFTPVVGPILGHDSRVSRPRGRQTG